MGDVVQAQSHFEQVERGSDNNISHVQCRNLINKWVYSDTLSPPTYKLLHCGQEMI